VGTIYYGGSATPIHVDDRALAHLKVVIATKLRRSEAFTVSWRHPDDQPRGRSTIWLHPSIPLRFVFDDPEPAELSRAWIEELANSANSSGGITLIAEHFDTGPVEVAPAAPDTIAPELVVAKIDVDELSIDKLTVESVDVPVQPAV
jgi:integrase